MDIVVLSKRELTELLREHVQRLRRMEALDIPPEASETGKKEWLSNREAMEYLDVSRGTLQRLRSEEILPYSKVRGSIYYLRKDLLAFLESGYSH